MSSLTALTLFAMSVMDDPEAFSQRSFDYLVIGGGTAGLTVAARLFEKPQITVVAVEAGEA